MGSTNLSITNIRLEYVTIDLWFGYGYISKTTAYLIPLMKEDRHFRTWNLGSTYLRVLL